MSGASETDSSAAQRRCQGRGLSGSFTALCSLLFIPGNGPNAINSSTELEERQPGNRAPLG